MRVLLAVLFLLISHEGTDAKPKPKPKPNPKAQSPFGGGMGGHGQLGRGGNDYGALPLAMRRRPVLGFNQMPPGGDYSLRAHGPLPIRPPANPNIVPLNGQGADYRAIGFPKTSASGMDYSDYCWAGPCPWQTWKR